MYFIDIIGISVSVVILNVFYLIIKITVVSRHKSLIDVLVSGINVWRKIKVI